MHNVYDIVTAVEPGAVVRFNWSYRLEGSMGNADDKCILILYCAKLNRFLYTIDSGMRSDGMATINAGAFRGKAVETWLAFISADQKEVATSLYTGRITAILK